LEHEIKQSVELPSLLLSVSQKHFAQEFTDRTAKLSTHLHQKNKWSHNFTSPYAFISRSTGKSSALYLTSLHNTDFNALGCNFEMNLGKTVCIIERKKCTTLLKCEILWKGNGLGVLSCTCPLTAIFQEMFCTVQSISHWVTLQVTLTVSGE